MQFWRDCWSSIHPFHLFISIYKHINTFEHIISLNQCMVWLSCRSVSQGDNWYRHAIMLQCLTNTNLLSVLIIILLNLSKCHRTKIFFKCFWHSLQLILQITHDSFFVLVYTLPISIFITCTTFTGCGTCVMFNLKQNFLPSNE